MFLSRQHKIFYALTAIIVVLVALSLYYLSRLPDFSDHLQMAAIIVLGSTSIFLFLLYSLIICERRRSEQGAEQKYKELVESANCAIIRMYFDGRVISVNSFAQKLFGCDEQQLIGRHLLETVLAVKKSNGEDQFAIVDRICSRPDELPLTELEFLSANNQRVLLSLSVKATMNADNTLNDILLIGQDISDRWQMQRLLDMSESNITSGKLATGIAHELNNPLGIIMQNLQNIKRRVSDTLPANERVAESVGIDLECLHRYLNERGINRMLEDTFSAGERAAGIISGIQKIAR